jgi:glutamate racemase
MTNPNPIGLFDSGIGGTSIWREIYKLMPSENTIYLADSKNAPYGIKTKEEIIELSIKNTEYLLNQNCKIIVVACNTATTNAIKVLRNKYDVPLIGIEPAIKPAALNSNTKKIGILATQGTINSELFHQTVLNFPDIKIVEQVGHGLVQLIEQGAIDSQEIYNILSSYLQPMITQNIDFLVLGCSHYPYLIPIIQKILPAHIHIIDSGEAVAKQTRKILSQVGFNNNLPAKNIFYTNDDVEVLTSFVKEFKVEYLDF